MEVRVVRRPMVTLRSCLVVRGYTNHRRCATRGRDARATGRGRRASVRAAVGVIAMVEEAGEGMSCGVRGRGESPRFLEEGSEEVAGAADAPLAEAVLPGAAAPFAEGD